MVRFAPPLIALLLLAAAAPASADHVAPTEIRWACGFGGGAQTGHPSHCGINPVGGGFDVGEDGPAQWGEAWTEDDEPILAIAINGDARAIPVVMLDSHEIANIDVGGQAVAVTYCPLCGSGVAFSRQVVLDGQSMELTFAASGFLYQSDLVMWDPQTNTLWNQISGAPIGALDVETVVASHHDVVLDTLPMLVTTWGAWHDQYPEATMLQKVRSAYYSPYGDYGQDDQRCGLSGCRNADGSLHPKELVIGVAEPGPVAFPLFGLDPMGGVLVTDVGSSTLVVATTPAGGTRVLDATGVGLDNSTGVWLDRDGDTWDLVANRDSTGQALLEVPSLRLYWFAWAEHYPETSLWEPTSGEATPFKKDNGKLPGFTIPIVAAFLLAGGLAIRWRRR